MLSVTRKILLVCTLMLVVLTTGAWQSAPAAMAESQNADLPELPLYPGLTWRSLGSSTRDIRINLNGDTISLTGEGYTAVEELNPELPQDILNYYSNAKLAEAGWASYDAFDVTDGVHYVFNHQSGIYLSVEFLDCQIASSNICITVWMSTNTYTVTDTSARTAEPNSIAATGSFGKKSPANGATGINPASVVLSWNAYSPTPDKYSYCIKEGVDCGPNDPEWTSVYGSTSVTLTNLAYGKTYHWQVKAITCVTCVPKTFVYADSGTWWTFSTKQGLVNIVGNAGIAGATLSYVDGTLKTVTADGTGAYSIAVPFNWSGTVTPTKAGYMFSPKSASFSNLTASQTIQNFTAIVAYTITGNVGISGVTLSYTDGVPQSVLSDASGNYTIIVPSNWSGTVTPSKTGYTFFPINKTYSNVTSNQTAQNYIAQVSISGNAGLDGVTLSYTDGTSKTVTSTVGGNYSITVPLGWSGTVTPSKTGYTFLPGSRSYVSLTASQTAQNYTAQIAITGNAGVGGAILGYVNGMPKVVAADGSGNYSITVPYNWSGTVIPGKSCYTFSPANHNYINATTSQTGQDFIATYNPGTYTLTGRTALPGVTLSYNDGTPKTVVSDGNGDYSITIPCDWNGIVTPTLTGYLFAPAARKYSDLTSDLAGQTYNLYNVSPADFNGDKKTDVAVFRPSNNTWYITGQGSYIYGQTGDIPVPADYNGDGKDDIAIFRPTNNTWYVRGQGSYVYGMVGDIPVVGDYNGDGKADIAVFRPTNSTWYIRGQGSFVYGQDGDIPVVADYNGDGKADIAVFRPANNTWYLYGIGPRVYGTLGDIPVVADYTGDGKADVAVFRPSNNTWYVQGLGSQAFGQAGDLPAIGDYNGDGKADIAMFRPGNSTWYILGVGSNVYGTIGDIPV